MLRFPLTSALIGLALTSGVAQARYIGPLLVKKTATGFTLPEYSKTETCEIFADRTVITTNFGGAGNLVSVKTLQQTFDGGYIDLLQEARRTRLNKQSGPVDGPSVQYLGFLIGATDRPTRVVLYDENGGTGEVTTNSSSAATQLKIVIDTLCPNTLQGFGPPSF